MSDFKLEMAEKAGLLQLPEKLTEKEVTDFKNQISGWLLAPVDFFVLNFQPTVVIERAFYQAFLQFRGILKSSDKNVYSINLTPELLAQIKNDGLDQALSPATDIEAARKSFTREQAAKNQIDLEFITPFLKGTKSVLESQCKLPLQVLRPFVLQNPITGQGSLENAAIAASLNFSSDRLSGNLVLSFTEELFRKAYEGMFEESLSEITKESEDAVGELLNMIYGAGKVELNLKGHGFLKAFPVILRGSQIGLREKKGTRTVVVPFEGGGSRLHLEIEFEER